MNNYDPIEFEELEERLEMAAGGSCERKCSGGDSIGDGDGGNGPSTTITIDPGSSEIN